MERSNSTKKNNSAEVLTKEVTFVKFLHPNGGFDNVVIEVFGKNYEEILKNIQIPNWCKSFEIYTNQLSATKNGYSLKTINKQKYIITSKNYEFDAFGVDGKRITIPQEAINEFGYIETFVSQGTPIPKKKELKLQANQTLEHFVKVYATSHPEYDDYEDNDPSVKLHNIEFKVSSNALEDIKLPTAKEYILKFVMNYCRDNGRECPHSDDEIIEIFQRVCNSKMDYNNWNCTKFDVYDVLETVYLEDGRTKLKREIINYQRYYVTDCVDPYAHVGEKGLQRYDLKNGQFGYYEAEAILLPTDCVDANGFIHQERGLGLD